MLVSARKQVTLTYANCFDLNHRSAWCSWHHSAVLLCSRLEKTSNLSARSHFLAESLTVEPASETLLPQQAQYSRLCKSPQTSGKRFRAVRSCWCKPVVDHRWVLTSHCLCGIFESVVMVLDAVPAIGFQEDVTELPFSCFVLFDNRRSCLSYRTPIKLGVWFTIVPPGLEHWGRASFRFATEDSTTLWFSHGLNYCFQCVLSDFQAN